MSSSVYTLELACANEELKQFYSTRANHHDDSGIDLYVPEDTWISCGETLFLSHSVKCRMIHNATQQCVPFLLYPRSSLSKTPLLLANSVGVIDKNYRGNIIAALKYLPHLYELQTLLQSVHEHVQADMVNIIKSCPTLDHDDQRYRIQDLTELNTNEILASLKYCILKHTRLVQICAADLGSISIKLVDNLDHAQTERGEGGFGSTNQQTSI